MDNTRGMVSVIMPTYNCAKYIEEAVKSVFAQTYAQWELIISDDCSTDGTRQKVMSLMEHDTRVRYICNEIKSGAAIARNNALRIARGRWIAFLDSDDLWDVSKLEHQVAFMEKNNYHFSCHEYCEIDEQGKPTGVYVSCKKKVGKFDMYSCCWPGCLTVMYDADYVGLIQAENIKRNNDTAMWLKVIRKSDCYLLKENLACYRRHRGSLTMPNVIEKIKWHYLLFRDAEKMNPISASFWMIMNIVGNSYKKLCYVKNNVNHDEV